jgi:hypothetical protein
MLIYMSEVVEIPSNQIHGSKAERKKRQQKRSDAKKSGAE